MLPHTKIITQELKDIPANSNPLTYDQVSMGVDINNNFMVLHMGDDNDDIIVVHIPSGRRIRLAFLTMKS